MIKLTFQLQSESLFQKLDYHFINSNVITTKINGSHKKDN